MAKKYPRTGLVQKPNFINIINPIPSGYFGFGLIIINKTIKHKVVIGHGEGEILKKAQKLNKEKIDTLSFELIKLYKKND